MLFGGFLGFAYVAVLLAVVLEVRRRWRCSVARVEEVKTLMATLAEEDQSTPLDFHHYVHVPTPCRTDTRQIEVDTGAMVYRCALCFTPATTRCSRCKAVRYCSGKCQILHWREGHKNECHPFTAPPQLGDVGGGSSEKVLLQQEGYEIHQNSSESEGSRYAESVWKSELNCSSVVYSVDRDKEAEWLPNEVRPVGACSSFDDINKRNGHHLNNIHIARSDQTNQIMGNGDADCTNELSISDPDVPLSGFWEGAFNSSLSKVDLNDEISQPSSPFKFDCKPDPLVVVKGSDNEIINRRSDHSTTLGFKRPVDVSISSCSTNTPRGRVRQLLSPEKANEVTHDTKTIVDLRISKRDDNFLSASVVQLPSITERHSFQNSKNVSKTSMLKAVDQLQAAKYERLSGSGCEITGRNKEKGLFPYELFVKLYNWRSVELIHPRGLLNCGNSCYANVIFQCLAFTPPLTAYLLQGLHSKTCKWKGWCFTCEFQSLMLKAKEENFPLSPAAMLSQIYKTKSYFGNGEEEDAHEFLRYAIDAMQLASLKEAGVNVSGSLEEETTLIGLTFGGHLRSKIKCMRCGAKSEHFERMMDLTVEIEGDVGTLEGALRMFTSTEILDGENKYQCSRSYERAKKKFRVLEAPNVLTIALKRFQSGRLGKIDKWIRFPEILDLAPFMSGTSDKSPIYRLYGVIVHLNSLNATYSGHYVCYVKNAENKWFKIDDSRVMAVDLESVLADQAYMLLYARCSPRAPRLIRNPKAHDPKNSKRPPIKSRSHSIDSWNIPTNVPLYDRHNGIDFEEDSLSENASTIFSEECSCSTESSNKDYSSTDDYFDNIFGNFGNDRIRSWKNSSDSESSSSSSASLSPIYPIGKAGVENLDSNSINQCRKLGSNSSCRETRSIKLGWVNPFGNKKPGMLFRRSVKERTN